VVRQPSVAERLHEVLNALTPTERRAATSLLGNYPVAGLESITQFARRAGVSGATILRLLGKLGFAGYPDFQEALRDELAARLQSPLGRWEDAQRRPAAGAEPDFLSGFADRIVANVRQTFQQLPRADFERVVTLLCQDRRDVHVIGGRFTARIADYLFVHLRAVRPGVQLVAGQSATWPDQLLAVRKNDTVVAFDVRRYQPDVATFCERAVERGARVVLLTDAWNSPIAACAAEVVLAHTESSGGWDSLAALLAVVEALIAATSARLGDRLTERMRTLEALRRGWQGPLDPGD